MTRLAQYESTGLIERMKRLRAELDAMKLTPQIVGASNLIIIEYKNGDGWDLQTTLAPFEEKKFRITYVFSSTKETYADVFIDWTSDQSSSVEVQMVDDPANVNQPDRKSWIVTATNWNMDFTATFNIKALIHSADTGTLTVVIA